MHFYFPALQAAYSFSYFGCFLDGDGISLDRTFEYGPWSPADITPERCFAHCKAIRYPVTDERYVFAAIQVNKTQRTLLNSKPNLYFHNLAKYKYNHKGRYIYINIIYI